VARLLHVEASPRKERSSSLLVARAFLESYAEARPEDEVDTLDLWTAELPEFDGSTIEAKYRILHREAHGPAEARAWDRVVEIFRRFGSADRYLFSVPMWNFGVPYKLKHLIDVITQPGLAFRYSSSEGYAGLVTGKPAVVIYARGSTYGDPRTRAMDFQRPYVEGWLRFVGFREIRSIVVEPTLGDAETTRKRKEEAVRQAREIAREI
jgi:FMN-dependent NADH-azoreductase